MEVLGRQELDAVYEGGVFRPLGPALLPEGAKVHLILEVPSERPPSPFELLLKVYDGLTPDQIAEVEAIALDRSHFMSPIADS